MLDIINIEQLSSIIRMIFSIIFFNKIYFAIKGFDFHWSHIESIKEKKIIYILLCITLILLVMLFVGLFSKLCALIIFLIYLYTFMRSSMFGLEDIYLNPLALYVVLSNNFYYSFDNILDLNNLSFNKYFLKNEILPELLTSIVCALIFFSSTCEKLRSKIWRKGLAVKYFFIHPKFRKINLEFIGRNKIFSILSGIIVLLSQGLILFCLFFPSKYGLLILFLLIVFALTLSIFFLYVGLAESCLLLLIIKSALFVFLWDESVYQFFLNNFNSFTLFEKYLSYFIFSFSFIYIINQLFSKDVEKKIVNKFFFLKVFFKLPRILGLVRVNVYTEHHLSNPVAFRALVVSKYNKIEEPYQLYNNDGTPHLKRVIFLPIVYMSIAFKIQDILIELDEIGEMSAFNYKFLKGFVQFLLKEKNIDFLKVKKIIFKINQLNIDEVATNNAEFNNEMIPLLELTISSNYRINVYPLKNKLLNYQSVRDNSYSL